MTAGGTSVEPMAALRSAGFGAPAELTVATAEDLAAAAEQLGRPVRGVLAVGFRCRHRVPAVLVTAPRLPDGSPFPTLYYLSCRVLSATVGRMESAGLMAEFGVMLAEDPELAAGYRRAHESYLHTREVLGDAGTTASAGGMPDRVKCLHALLAHTLAVGTGVNPIGDLTLQRLPDFSRETPPCAP